MLGYVAYKSIIGNRTEVDLASPSDAQYVLNCANLGEVKIEKIIHSYVSDRNITGDHLDAFAIKVVNIKEQDLREEPDTGGGWHRGDRIPPVIEQAYKFLDSWRSYVDWLPSQSDLQSPDYYVYPWKISFHGTLPTEAELIIVCPSERMIFFFGAKT